MLHSGLRFCGTACWGHMLLPQKIVNTKTFNTPFSAFYTFSPKYHEVNCYCLNPMRRKFGDHKISRRTEVFLQLLYGSEANSKVPFVCFAYVCLEISILLKLEISKQTKAKADKSNLISHWKMKKISAIGRLVLLFPDT